MNAAGRGRKRVKLGAARGSGKQRGGGWEGVVEKTGGRTFWNSKPHFEEHGLDLLSYVSCQSSVSPGLTSSSGYFRRKMLDSQSGRAW